MLAHPPLKSRIITTSAGVRAPPVLTQARATGYKCWDMDSMQDAIAEVEKGMSQREAAVRYQVPRSTLQGYINGESSLMSRSGCPLLTLTEEDELATFLVEVAKIGYPHTRKQIIAKVQEMVNSKGRNTAGILWSLLDGGKVFGNIMRILLSSLQSRCHVQEQKLLTSKS